ncbi:MAG: PKD domain-containing protein [Bacteroidales bacterium]|nr:MAG: PKD domain-containing protein [Bacteroidales bacterium]
MKKLAIPLLIVPFFLFSCKKEPVAGFYASDTEVDIQEFIHFTNNSRDARYYDWDFGDGTSSTDVHPSHKYEASGDYTVTLTAISEDNLVDRAFMDIEVFFPPLEIRVLEWYDEYPVEGASVWLYATYEDWLTHSDATILAEGYTDSEGWVIFTDVGPYIYYVDVWEEYHDNYTLASENINFIRTPQLVNDDFNVFIAWVDYYPDGKKGEERDGTRILKTDTSRSPDQKQIEINRKSE